MITSPKNRYVVRAAKLKKRAIREQERRFLVEGAQAVSAALDVRALELLFVVPGANDRLDRLAADAAKGGIPVVEVSERIAAHLTSAVTPQGIVGIAEFVDRTLEEASPDLVPVLCSVRDPGNAGTILRSADAAGATAVVFGESSVDVYNPKTVRASAGSLFHLPVVRDVPVAEAVRDLRSRGAQVLAATPTGEISAYETDLRVPTAILLGNEAWGLTPEVLALADHTVRVPIRGRAESLNLAAAAALLLFEATRQRETPSASSFAAEIAAGDHDIRSPLAGFGGMARTLADRWEEIMEERRRALVSGMALDAERGSALVRLIVDAARLEAGEFRPSIERIDLSELAGQVARSFAVSEDAPEVVIRGRAETLTDRERVRAILVVLSDVAWRRGHIGPIEVRIEGGAEPVSVAVGRASGMPGTAPAVVEERTAQLLRGPAEGGDIRLRLCLLVVRGLGGDLTVDTEGGIRFRLELPGPETIR